MVFIDDSGDPGFKEGSSDNFVMAAVVFEDVETANILMQEIDTYRQSLGWRRDHEFKFAKSPKSVILTVLNRARKNNFKIYAIYIKKSYFRNIMPAMVQFMDGEKLYAWAIRELLCEIPLKQAKITIDGRANKQYRKKMATYLRKEVRGKGVERLEFKFDDSVTTSLLQFADLIAGSINRSLQTDKTDALNYIATFQIKIASMRQIDCV